MNNKVKLKKGQLDYFRKLSRQSPLEIQAYLVGQVVTPNLTLVEDFVYPPAYGLQTRYQAAWFRRDYDIVRREAEERGRRVIGSIHSHPNMDDAVLSPDDYESCIAEGHRICGIVTTNGTSSRVRFWVMDSALPADIEYDKSKAAPARPEGTRQGHTDNAQ
jgi:proteasome lid subunit RPN8/RPN11